MRKGSLLPEILTTKSSQKDGSRESADVHLMDSACDIMSDFSLQFSKNVRALEESLNSCAKIAQELSQSGVLAAQSLMKTSDPVVNKCVLDSFTFMSSGFMILSEFMNGVRVDLDVHLLQPCDSLLKCEIPHALMKRSSIQKTANAYAELKQRGKKKADSAKLFELEQEENILVKALEENQANGLPVIRDGVKSFSRFVLGSSIKLIQTLVDHSQRGLNSFTPLQGNVKDMKRELRLMKLNAYLNRIAAALGLDETVFQGNLSKKAGQGRHWQQRQCILKPNYLFYFDGSSLKGGIPIENSTVEEHKSKTRNHCFVIHSHGRDYKFEAKDEDEKDLWIDALKSCNPEKLPERSPISPLINEVEKHLGIAPISSYPILFPSVNSNSIPTLPCYGSGISSSQLQQLQQQYERDPKLGELMGTISSEKVYLSNLESIQIYRQNLQKEGIFSENVGPNVGLSSLMDSVDELFSHHASLLGKLEAISQDWPGSADAVAALFLSSLSKFELYSMYAKIYAQIKQPLSKAISSDTSVKRSLESIRKKHSSEHSFLELLFRPLSRLDRYVQLLQTFIQKTSPTDKEYESVVLATEGMSKLTESLEGHMEMEKNVREMMRISRLISGCSESVYKAGRCFVCEGSASVQKKGEKSEKNDFYLFLFSDILIMATQRHIVNKYNFATKYNLSQLGMPTIEGDNSFSIIVNKHTLFFQFSSPEKYQFWYDKLHESIREALGKRCFGKALEEIFNQPQNQGRDVPEWLDLAILHVSNYSLKIEGIFRKSASAESIQECKDELDSGRRPVFNQSTDPHVVCCLIKIWLRELPTKLITVEYYNQLVEAVEEDDPVKKVKMMKAVISSLPDPILFLFQHLISFMRLAATYSDHSKMTPSNLGIVFGPNLIQSPNQLDSTVNIIIEEMIVFYDPLFREIEKKRMECKKKMRDQIAKEKSLHRELQLQAKKVSDQMGQLPSFSNQIVKQSWLAKKGHVRTNWSTRWFVLKYNWLGYYKSQEEINGVPKGSIVLKECIFTDMSEKRSFSFSLYDPRQARTFYIQAKNATEHSEWSEAIISMISDVSLK